MLFLPHSFIHSQLLYHSQKGAILIPSPKRFCVKCGKFEPEVSLIGALCPKCYREEIPPIRFKKTPSLVLCRQCIATKSGSKWYYPSSEDLKEFVKSSVTKSLKARLELQDTVELVNIDPIFSLDVPSKEIDVTISLKRDDYTTDSHIEKIQLAIPLEYQLCPRCSRITSGSYEAILQIRGVQGTLSPKEREMILSSIEHTLERRFKDHPQSFISKIVPKHEGIDLYFFSFKCANTVAYTLRDSVAASIRITSKLVGLDRSTSKRQYRVNISVRIPHLRIGDFMMLDNSVYEILAIGGGKISLRSLETGTRRSLSAKTLWSQLSSKQLKVLKKEEYVFSYLVIAITSDSLQIMNMKTYETYEIQKAIDKNLTSGDVIKGFQKNGKIFLL